MMGRMKELFIEEQQKESMDLQNMYDVFPVYKTNELCPNCTESTLIQMSKHNYSCDRCAQDFVLVEGSLRFK